MTTGDGDRSALEQAAYAWLDTYEVRERADTGTDLIHYPCGSTVTELETGDSLASVVELTVEHEKGCTA
jgi:hypothetical protein